MKSRNAKRTQSEDAAGEGSEPPPPPYNDKLDPDNVTSPREFTKRVKEGRKHFYPEGGPEDPPTENYDEEYGR